MPEVSFADVDQGRILWDGLYFPECPRYFGGEIYFVDGAAVRAVTLDGRQRTVATLPVELCLGLHVAADGTVYVGTTFARKIYRIRDGHVDVAADLTAHCSSGINEFVLLPDGSFLIGQLGFDPGQGQAPQWARLLFYPPDGNAREVGPEMMFANGMVLSPDATTLWVAESFGPHISRFTLAPDGELTDRVVLPLETDRVPNPDGLSVARDGTVWYGDMFRGAAVAVGPEGGALQWVVDVPKPHATSCVVFEEDGEEWLAVLGTEYPPAPQFAELRTGQVVALPLDAITNKSMNRGQ